MLRLPASSLTLAAVLVSVISLSAATALREAPTPTARPANQLAVSGNACGPTALLNAFRFANSDWHRASDALTGTTDKQLIYTIIREYGMRPSAHIKGRPRWSRNGVNLADLVDIANEMTRGHFLPKLSEDVLFRKLGESPEKLLKRVHARFNTSLEKGFPPLISLRRYVKRDGSWVALEAHFVTLVALPHKLDRGATSFAIRYIDPWGGKSCDGQIAISDRPLLADVAANSPCLVADFPQSTVGKKLVRRGEFSTLAAAAVLGRW